LFSLPHYYVLWYFVPGKRSGESVSPGHANLRTLL
jgi:hypothetical protein